MNLLPVQALWLCLGLCAVLSLGRDIAQRQEAADSALVDDSQGEAVNEADDLVASGSQQFSVIATHDLQAAAGGGCLFIDSHMLLLFTSDL